MSKYTIELRRVIEHYTQYDEGKNRKVRLKEGTKKFFDDIDYPFFDESKRDEFQEHFVRNFYTREIGFETLELFKMQLETWLQINMPYYNKLFESELIKFEPLKNTEMETVSKNVTESEHEGLTINNRQGSNEGESKNNSESESIDDDFNRHLQESTPQTQLNITAKDGEGLIKTASEINENTINNKNNTTQKGEGTQNSSYEDTQDTDSYSKSNSVGDTNSKTYGKIGSETYSEMLLKYRETFLRIENMIFKELNKLFMLIY